MELHIKTKSGRQGVVIGERRLPGDSLYKVLFVDSQTEDTIITVPEEIIDELLVLESDEKSYCNPDENNVSIELLHGQDKTHDFWAATVFAELRNVSILKTETHIIFNKYPFKIEEFTND